MTTTQRDLLTKLTKGPARLSGAELRAAHRLEAARLVTMKGDLAELTRRGMEMVNVVRVMNENDVMTVLAAHPPGTPAHEAILALVKSHERLRYQLDRVERHMHKILVVVSEDP